MSIHSVMNDIAELLSPAEPLGGWDDSEGKYTVQGYAPCRLIAVSGNQFLDGRIRNETTHVLFTVTDLPVEPNWIIRIGNTDYEIIPPVNDAGGRLGHHLELQLKEYS